MAGRIPRRRSAISRSMLWVIVAVVVVVVAVGGVYAYMVTSRPSAPSAIVVGWPAPVTGSFAPFGSVDPWIASYVQNYINQNMGGIYIPQYGRKIPIEIIVKDTQSSPSTTATVTQQLITQYHVNMLVVAHTPATVPPAAAVAEKYGVPLIADDCPVSAFIGSEPAGGYHWSYDYFWAFPQTVYAHLQIVNELRNYTNGKMAIISSADADAQAYDPIMEKMATAYGYQVVYVQTFPYGTTDFTSAIMAAKAANATILVGVMIPPDFATLWRQAISLGWHPTVVVIAKAMLFPSEPTSMGDTQSYGIGTEIWWYPTLNYTSPLLGINTLQWTQMYEAKTGNEWSANIGYDIALMDEMYNVLSRTPSLDPLAINQTIYTTNLNTIAGTIDYQNPFPNPQIKQLIETYEPDLLQPQNVGHYSLSLVMSGQWVPGGPWGWTLVPVYNAGTGVATYPAVPIPVNPENATLPYTPPYFVPPS